ncbi:hypothetical protein [Egicoccus halophilus]|uniref:PQQ-like domain-containing protein n=1 Tax=Egicoccus halophilus TaxID=1670830 RepID=A0A8J3A8R5_9ACTN|nr:hypothetical protein [Egicoccus halophilus]GGI06865.1 hypothetical protein GCM10011354_21230 [Egicoccus halophilus]
MSDPTVPEDLDPVRGTSDDPLSADRRVLAIGALAMVLLIVVGVVAASVFTRSACADIAVDTVPAGTAGDLETVLTDGLGDLFDDERQVLLDFLTGILPDRLGPVTGAVDVLGAEGLTPVGTAGERLVAATGTTTTVIDVAAVEAAGAVDVGSGTVVGSGPSLYDLALINPGTGQTDAFLPLDARLDAGDCLDTATVGTSFAFFLDAADGQLLLFRVEEDGEFPELELRDAHQGQIWASHLDVPEIPPGITGERLDAQIGDDLVVVGRRTTVEDETPIVSAFTRDTGAGVWSLELPALLDAAPAGDTPVWVDVLDVDTDTTLLGLSREDRQGEASLVALDSADGSLRWADDLDAAVPVTASLAGDTATVVVDTGTDVEVRLVDLAEGATRQRASRPDPAGEAFDGRVGIVPLDDATLVVAGTSSFVVGPGEQGASGYRPEASQARLVDAVRVGNATVVLVTSEDGAVAVVYGDA